jgi:hypothetical protein
VTDPGQAEWLAALTAASDRLNTALVTVPQDKGALLQAIGEGVALLLAREIERISPPSKEDPSQLHLFPEGLI